MERRRGRDYTRPLSALLSLENVARRFGGIVALDDVSFTVEQGQIVGLIGPNGAGKTTAFNVISRLYRPSAGNVVFDGRDLLRVSPHRVLKLGIARTFQNLALFTHMTVLENILVAADSHYGRLRERQGHRSARETLEYVGLAEVADAPASGLPYGTLKRVEIGRALVAQPRLLLLDEPAGGLSHEEVGELAAFVRRIRDDRDLTVLLVEHHMNLVMGVSDTVHVLDFGRLIATGPPELVRDDPAVIEAYLGPERPHVAS